MKQLFVNVGKGYNIFIQKGILANCGSYVKDVTSAQKIVLISDTNVNPLYAPTVISSLEAEGYQVFNFVFEAGEQSKVMSTVMSMVEFMAQNQLTRKDLVVALGGGVCGDMAGFAASIYLRGIDFVQIPTSLLAQVDSSVGGKTAVDLPQGKNLCGAFHQPALVLIDTHVLSTLTPHYFADGMAEVIKTACIKDADLFDRLEKEDAVDFIEDMIFNCVSIKAGVVERDEKEQGERALLNFGHTAGHAIEKLHNFTTISHGEAVGIGMVLVTKACENNNILPSGTCLRISNMLQKYNLKITDNNSLPHIIQAMGADKKSTGKGINFVLLNSIGDSYTKLIPYQDIPKFFGI